jgi:hypothetical protein
MLTAGVAAKAESPGQEADNEAFAGMKLFDLGKRHLISRSIAFCPDRNIPRGFGDGSVHTSINPLADTHTQHHIGICTISERSECRADQNENTTTTLMRTLDHHGLANTYSEHRSGRD